jgi:hypothetical protein
MKHREGVSVVTRRRTKYPRDDAQGRHAREDVLAEGRVRGDEVRDRLGGDDGGQEGSQR